MKVAIIGKFYTEAFGLHIEETLLEMGHEVVRIDPEMNFMQYKVLGKRIRNINKTLYQQVFHKIGAVRNIKSKEIYSLLKEKKVDFTLVLHDYLTAAEVTEIKRISKAPIAIWFPDAVSNFQKSMFFVAGYDHLFFKDKYLVETLKNEFNLNTHYMPQCCNPLKHQRVSLSEYERAYYECEITNAGNLYPSRAALLKNLTDYNIKLWGLPPAIWLKVPELNHILMNKVVYNEEKSKAFSAAKIVLNNLHPAEINGLNKRTFEVPACGGFQISTWRDNTKDLFEIDKEIICYKTLGELKEKINYYLNPSNEGERSRIIEAGYKRTIEDHTYKNRLLDIFKTVGLN